MKSSSLSPRSLSFSSLAIVAFALWAFGCGERADNPLFASDTDGPSPGAGGEGGGSSEVDAGDPKDSSVGEEGGFGGQGGSDSPVEDGGDAAPDALPDAPDVCRYEYGPGPFARQCRPPTDNECDGLYDNGPLPNGQYGNGLDDDCDGIVDEGCTCGPSHSVGSTRTCYLVPPSQIDPATREPVGVCKEGSKGTMSCVQNGNLREWDGHCKGARPPHAEDSCDPVDYDCDGFSGNSKSLDCNDCDPARAVVACPTEPIVTSPYPDPTDLTKKKNNPLDPAPSSPFLIDGHDWIVGADPGHATNWKWTVTGGDCDNVLPHPNFAIYNGPSAYTSTRIGVKSKSLGDGRQTGFVIGGAGSTESRIYPAFSLSGDYVVKGEFDLEGQRHECSVTVKSRWPGLRAELCWDSVGESDLDLHLARLQGQSCTHYGWFDTCPGLDCHHANCKSVLNWGYPTSADEACRGWGSRRASTCNNPRIDQDTVSCNRNQANPLATDFCAAENINHDAPKIGDQFAIGVHHRSGRIASPRVNVYCNGERMLATGNDPAQASSFPVLRRAGEDRDRGDFWSVARVTWLGGEGDGACKIEPVPSEAPRSDRDGSSAYCVDTDPRNATTGSSQWHFKSPGNSLPTGPKPSPFQAGQWFCWH